MVLRARPPRSETPARKLRVDARRLEPGAPSWRPGAVVDFFYSVTTLEPPRADGERRGASRQRTRLRSGKITGPDGRFIVECLIHNRSLTGCRVRLPRVAEIPSAIYLFDDRTGELSSGSVAWRRDRDLGLRLKPCPVSPPYRALADRMRHKFYALPR